MTNKWQELILKNFNSAATQYNANAQIQKSMALKLASICSKQSIPRGIWADLGSGTGLLAESLEALNPNQSVIRIDSSSNMIAQQTPECLKKIWDLNLGLPVWPAPPQLLASNFVLHWLIEPQTRLQEWFQNLAEGGWIAISLPIQGSFPEWYQATVNAQVPYTAIELPSKKSLFQAFPQKQLRHTELIRVTQTASNISSLFKSMIKVGAHSSLKPSLSISEWRKLKNNWPINTPGKFNLTWNIQMLLVQK